MPLASGMLVILPRAITSRGNQEKERIVTEASGEKENSSGIEHLCKLAPRIKLNLNNDDGYFVR